MGAGRPLSAVRRQSAVLGGHCAPAGPTRPAVPLRPPSVRLGPVRLGPGRPLGPGRRRQATMTFLSGSSCHARAVQPARAVKMTRLS